MTRRSGVTLVEVLVAIFVMGIGLMALLTLFPIGMLRMAQSIRDAKSVDSAEAAYSIQIMQNVRNDPLVVSDGTIPDFFKNPNPNGPGAFKDAELYGESYPVFVDPIGYNAAPVGLGQDWVGSRRDVCALRRRPVFFTGGTAVNIYKSFTLWDDINFNGVLDNVTAPGAPQTVTGTTTVLRDTRYSWAYVYRRPCTSDRSIAECTVVVFDKRSLALGANLALAETAYPNTFFNPNNNTITIPYGATLPAPAVRPGDWILDNTLIQTATSGTAHAYFYRVVAGEDFVVGGNTYARYEVQNPIRGFVPPAFPFQNATDPITGAPNLGYQGTAIIIEGIADVYEKGPVRLP